MPLQGVESAVDAAGQVVILVPLLAATPLAVRPGRGRVDVALSGGLAARPFALASSTAQAAVDAGEVLLVECEGALPRREHMLPVVSSTPRPGRDVRP